MENWRLEGKRVIVTGAGSGIGRAITILFADAEADVIMFDLNGTSAQETAAAISVEASGRISAIACNVSDEASIGSAFAKIADGGDPDVLARTGLPGSLLQLELTESATLLDLQHAARTIQRLKEIGVTVAIDDFGTGYSCLSYLPKLAFNALKIDRSFVREMIESSEAKALVESILTLARNLDMKVIVEGVENREQLRMIGELGGKEAQGYLLGRPTPEPIAVLRQALADQGVEERVATAV